MTTRLYVMCPDCLREFPKRSGLRMHLLNAHGRTLEAAGQEAAKADGYEPVSTRAGRGRRLAGQVRDAQSLERLMMHLAGDERSVVQGLHAALMEEINLTVAEAVKCADEVPRGTTQAGTPADSRT